VKEEGVTEAKTAAATAGFSLTWYFSAWLPSRSLAGHGGQRYVAPPEVENIVKGTTMMVRSGVGGKQ